MSRRKYNDFHYVLLLHKKYNLSEQYVNDSFIISVSSIFIVNKSTNDFEY